MHIVHYQTSTGNDPYTKWLMGLKDKLARVAILRHTDRLAGGHLGEHRFCRDGVWELKIDVGPGYRVYYARSGKEIILLLCGGSKRTQSKDIERAVHYWNDYQRRI
jgi:putative addiction module killer protein